MLTTIKTILVVDDEPDILLVIETSLKLEVNWTIWTASSGEEGLLQAKTKCPDVILSDIDMPQMDGIEMTSALREDNATKHIPVILMTAIPWEINTQNSPQLGVTAIIPKPFDSLTLAQQIVQAVN